MRLWLFLCAVAVSGCDSPPGGGADPDSGRAEPQDGAAGDSPRADARGPDAATGLEITSAKGIDRIVQSAGLDDSDLSLHISEVGPGDRLHPPHTHGGYEGFYVLEGTGKVVIGEEEETLAAGEAALFDARLLHGIRNVGDDTLRYMVIKSD